MNAKVMWVLVVLGLLVGAYAGYAYEKSKFVKLMAVQRADMQKEIDNAKMAAEVATKQPDVVMMAKDAKGSHLTAANGMALYTYDKDTKGQSNCSGVCEQKWPPYAVSGAAPTALPEHVGIIKRADGSMQYTWNDMPLYFYASDKDAKDVYGDAVGGVWHIIK